MRRKPPSSAGPIDARARELSAALDRESEARRASERSASRCQQLLALTAALCDSTTSSEVLDAALARLREQPGVSAVLIALIEEDRLVVRRTEGFSDTFVEQLNAGVVESANTAVETGKPIVIRDSGEAALAAIPLAVDDRILGVVALRFEPAEESAAGAAEFLDAIGRQCARALERARLFDSEREGRRALVREHAYMQAVLEQTPSGVRVADAGDVDEARAQLMAVFQGMAEAVAILDHDRLILANDTFVRTHGVGAGYYTDVMGSIEVRSMTGELVPVDEWPSSRALRGEAVHQVELQLRRTDTGRSWIGSYSAAPVRNANGDIVQAVLTMRDITEQKRAEQALRESEERLRLAQNSANVGVWDRDMQSGAVNFLPELYRLYGLPEGTITTYEQWRTLVHPDDVERIEAELAAALRRKEPFDSEFRVLHSSGEIRWINAKGGGIFDDAGNVVRLLGVNIDITDRKMAEHEREQLLEMLGRSASEARRNRAQLEAVFQAMHDAVVVFDARGEAIFVNEAGARIGGLTVEEMKKPFAWFAGAFEATQPDGSVLPADQWPASRALRGESFTDWELSGKRLDTGQSWFLSFSGSPVYDEAGNLVLAVVITRDVTERKRRERELREAQERLARTQEFSLVMALHVGLDGKWLKVPPTFVRFLGYDTEEELVGRHFKDFTHPGDFEADWSQVLQLLRGEIKSFEMEKRFLRRDGSVTWGYINCSIVTDVHERPVHLLTYVRDINAQKGAERALRESEARLKTVIENLAEGLIVFDPEGRDMQLNRAALQMHGYSRQEEVLSHLPDPFLNLFELSTLDGKVLPFEQWPIPRLIRGEDITGCELRLRNKQTGWQRLFSHGGTIVRDEAGRPVMGLLSLRDITEQKQAERAIRESEQQYKTLAENAPEVIARFDRALHHTYVNEYGAKVYGIPREAIIGKTSAELGLPADKVAFWRTQLEAVFQTGKQRTVDFEFDSPTFGHQYFSSIFVPEFDETGAAGSILAITRDVTALKTAEQALRDSEARLQLAVDAAELGTWDIDIVTGEVVTSPRIREIFGIGPARQRSQFLERVHPDDRDRLEAELKQAEAALSGYETEFRITRPSGELRWAVTKGTIIPDAAGRAARRIGIVQDITERKRAEDALRDSERWFRELAELLPQLVCVALPDGQHIYFNHRWYEQTGASEEESLGERWADILHPEDRERTLAYWRHCLETGKPYEIEYRLRVAQGEYRWFLGRAMPVRDETGRILRWFGTCTDIEDSKRAEQRARETQKLESIGLLAGGIAHDFNNLLTGILGNASLVLDEVGPGAAARVKSIVNGAERAAHLTRQLLAYSGKGQFFLKDLDLSQAVREMADLLHLSIPKTVELRLDLQQRLPFVTIDPGQLQQVIMNLVINAGEAIGESRHGRITVSTGVREIDRPFVDALGIEISPGRYIYLEVADTGHGMDEATRSKIFDPFFTTKFTGRGLGLAAVSGIVRSQQGAIAVDSAPGRGTTFAVLFPVSERMPGEAPEREAAGRATLLVVDDEESVREFIREVLRREGYGVLLASDGRAALALWEKNQDRIDAAIVDIMMPGMGGNDLLQQLKSLRPQMRVLLTSGYSEAEVRRLSAKYSDMKFIQKPYTAQALAQAVASLIG